MVKGDSVNSDSVCNKQQRVSREVSTVPICQFYLDTVEEPEVQVPVDVGGKKVGHLFGEVEAAPVAGRHLKQRVHLHWVQLFQVRIQLYFRLHGSRMQLNHLLVDTRAPVHLKIYWAGQVEQELGEDQDAARQLEDFHPPCH